MKNENSICSLLGITQNELAMLLGVSRSQCAMFETGQRDLPLHAKQLLSGILTHMQSYDATAKNNTAPQKITRDQLERLVRENEYQQLLLERKIASIAKKQEAQGRLLHLYDFLNAHPTYKNAKLQLYQTIAAKASPKRKTEFSETIKKLQHQLEILILEQQVLTSKALNGR
jgi:transcriptional regulator with XRE-family HTH domain